jgi:hypothetical protein
MTSMRMLAPLGVSLLLSACGGGSGAQEGVPFIPGPSIISQYSYKRVIDLPASNHELQAPYYWAVGTHGNPGPTVFGQSLSVRFDSATGTYTVSAPSEGKSRTFLPSERSTTAGPRSEIYIHHTDDGFSRLTIDRDSSVALTYTMFGQWHDMNNRTGESATRNFVTGSSTRPDDMPKGIATYRTRIRGSAVQIVDSSTGFSFEGGTFSSGPSSATISVDFQSGQISTTLNLKGTNNVGGETVDFGSYSGTAAIVSASSSYTGELKGDRGSGLFTGGFFGPQAAETGYVWAIKGNDFSAGGEVSGHRNLP